MIKFLFKWQTLVGALLGGLFALAMAFVVALTMRRREEKAAGMVVSKDLAAIRITSEAIKISMEEEENITEDEYPFWFSDKLVQTHPKLSTLFEASVARIMPIDVFLAVHLSMVQQTYSSIETKINKLSDDYNLKTAVVFF